MLIMILRTCEIRFIILLIMKTWTAVLAGVLPFSTNSQKRNLNDFTQDLILFLMLLYHLNLRDIQMLILMHTAG